MSDTPLVDRVLARDPRAIEEAKGLIRQLSDALRGIEAAPDTISIDHVGIAVSDVDASLRFFTGVLGLASSDTEDIKGQHSRVRFIDTGDAKLELVESMAPNSPIGRYIEKRGPGLHHVALRVTDIYAAIARVTAAGVQMIDTEPRRGAKGSLIAFVHPGDTHGVLVELKQPGALKDPV